MNIPTTQGLIAAPPTGFQAEGRIDLAVVTPLAEHLHRQGVSGVFVNGTTGEGLSLNVEERQQLAAEWRRVVPPSMKLIVHVGHNSLTEARCLAEHAQTIGADAIGALYPGFFQPAALDPLIDWCAAIAAGAPELPFYYYHMPSMTGIRLSVASFLAAAADRIPTLAGAKFTYEALADYTEALRMDGGRFDVLWGRDEMLLGALASGAKGCVGSNYNVAAPLFLRLVDAFHRGDFAAARDLQAEAISIIRELEATGNFFAALKAMLRDQGIPISCRVRPPLQNLEPIG